MDMNDPKTIPGFHPRAMGSLAGLMLLSAVLAMLPARSPRTAAPVQTAAAAR